MAIHHWCIPKECAGRGRVMQNYPASHRHHWTDVGAQVSSGCHLMPYGGLLCSLLLLLPMARKESVRANEGCWQVMMQGHY